MKEEIEMYIAICDDEPVFTERLKVLLSREFSKYNEPCVFITSVSGSELLEQCLSETIDVVFLDIAMPGIDGMETAKRLRAIRSEIMIVFVSSKESFIYDTYEYNPIWFIPKNQISMLGRAVKKITEKSKFLASNFIQLRLENEIIELNVHNIKYFKTIEHYVNYYNRDNIMSKSYRCKLVEVEAQLSALWFVRSHNRYLVNLQCVRAIDKKELVLFDNERIPISRAYINTVREKFQDYFRSVR